MIPKALLEHLLDRYRPNAILLHGSRARNDYFENSDYDLLLIGTFAEPVVSEQFQGFMLDAEGIPPGQDNYYSSGHVPIWPLVILYDDAHQYGEKLLQKNRSRYEQGPEPLSDQQIKDRKNRIRRLVTKLSNRANNLQMRMHYAADIHDRFIRYYFELSGRWPLSLHLALEQIKREDETLYQNLSNLFTEQAIEETHRIFQKIFSEQI